MKCDYVTFVWWFRGGSTNNPLGSIGIFILKDSILPEVLYLPRVREKEWKSETTKTKMVNFKMATMPGEISTTHLCGRPSPVPPQRTFCRLPAVARHLPATILIFKPSTRKIVRAEQWKLERSKNSDMAVTVLHDQKCSNSGAPRTGTRSGRLHKARWEKEANDGLLHASFLLWLFVILFSFHCITCFSNKSFGGVVG